ncbi:MAG: CBS domain-containing protein [Blautia sp.]
MNILFFLTPKEDVAYVFEDESLRQTLERMEHRKFACVPILNKDGKYIGSISEGDLLWGLKKLGFVTLKEMEKISIMSIPRRAHYKPVRIDSNMEDLIDKATQQNYVPVIDDGNNFIGIVTRKDIIQYCYNNLQKKECSNACQKKYVISGNP